MFGVGGNLDPVAFSQQNLISGHIEQHFASDDDSNLGERMAVIGDLMAGFKDFFKRLQTLELKKNLKLFG